MEPRFLFNVTSPLHTTALILCSKEIVLEGHTVAVKGTDLPLGRLEVDCEILGEMAAVARYSSEVAVAAAAVAGRVVSSKHFLLPQNEQGADGIKTIGFA